MDRLRIEAEFRRRWWPCEVAYENGAVVAVNGAAGTVGPNVPLRVRWRRRWVSLKAGSWT